MEDGRWVSLGRAFSWVLKSTLGGSGRGRVLCVERVSDDLGIKNDGSFLDLPVVGAPVVIAFFSFFFFFFFCNRAGISSNSCRTRDCKVGFMGGGVRISTDLLNQHHMVLRGSRASNERYWFRLYALVARAHCSQGVGALVLEYDLKYWLKSHQGVVSIAFLPVHCPMPFPWTQFRQM